MHPDLGAPGKDEQMSWTSSDFLFSPCGEDLLEEERATHSSILAWEIPWTEEPGEFMTCGHKESDTTQ